MLSETFQIPAVEAISIVNEKHASFPVLNPHEKPYHGASKMRTGKLVGKLIIASAVGEGAVIYQPGRDYIETPDIGIGRTPDSAIKKLPVYFTYKYLPSRCDSVLLSNGKLVYRAGRPASPLPDFPRYSRLLFPELQAGETRLANIYLPTGFSKLTRDMIFPVMESAYPISAAPTAEQLLPKTMAKLRNGKKIEILAWGDSITAGAFEPGEEAHWQNQVVRELRRRFPKSRIELTTEAWGGHNTSNYLLAKPGSTHNYQEKVLGRKPDLVISHWHNDGISDVIKNWPKILSDFKSIGAEWLIIIPYCNSLEMNLQSNYPKWSSAPLQLKFARENRIACGDCCARTQRLWRQGIPRMAYSAEGRYHPGIPGMALIAESALEVFPKQ